MNLLKDKRFFKFLIPSLIGAFLFVTPIQQDGNLTIPIAVAANKLLDLMGDYALTVIWTYYQPSPKADPTIDIFFRDKMPFPQRIELTQPPSVVG